MRKLCTYFHVFFLEMTMTANASDSVDIAASDTKSNLTILKTNEKGTEDNENPTTNKKEPPPKIPFKCTVCHFIASCDYNGKKPPFSKNVNFTEECYVMQDPFSPPPSNISSKSNSEYFIVVGSNCVKCKSIVCSANTCSIFYGRTYCGNCAYECVTQFPLEIQSKIRKFFRKH